MHALAIEEQVGAATEGTRKAYVAFLPSSRPYTMQSETEIINVVCVCVYTHLHMGSRKEVCRRTVQRVCMHTHTHTYTDSRKRKKQPGKFQP